MKPKEYILCAAIWYKDHPTPKYGPTNIDRGVVLCGHRHGPIIHQHVALMGKRQAEMGEYVQGFLTSENRFVDRFVGATIHMANGGELSSSQERLFSEDLY